MSGEYGIVRDMFNSFKSDRSMLPRDNENT